MGWHDKLAAVFVTTVAVASSTALQAQGVGKYFAPKDQVIAIRAGRLFDAKSGSILKSQCLGRLVGWAEPIVKPSAFSRLLDRREAGHLSCQQ